MTKNEEINNALDELIKGEDNQEKLQKLSQLKALNGEAIKEESELLKRHSDLTASYKQLILNSPATKDAGKTDGGYTPPKQTPSFEDFFKQEVSKLEKGNK